MCKNFAFTSEEYFEDNFAKQKTTLAKRVTKAHRQRKLSLAQVSYEKSNHKLRVLDISGTGHKLNDSIMASLEFH